MKNTVIENFGDLQPGWTVKMVTRDRAGGVVCLVVATVKRVTREKSSGYIRVTFTDYLDVNNTEGVVNTHTLRLCKGDLNDREFTCDGMFSHSITRCTKAAYKEAARKLRKLHKRWVSELSTSLAKAKKDVERFTVALDVERRRIESLNTRFGI